jgi:heat-inducible transcriptional repressor
MELTDRQIAIIKAAVEEFTETAKPVGSVTLEKKYKLGVSPATLRNEMAVLEEKGFLSQGHTSAGRTPTSAAIKFYIKQLMKEQDLSVAEEVSVKEKVWDHRFDADSLLREACQVLASRAKSLSVATTSSGKTYHAGYANLLSFPEFFNIDVTRKVLELLDGTDLLSDVFGRAIGNQPVHVLIGHELGPEFFEPVSLIFADLQIGDKKGSLGVISSYRQEYQKNIPLVRYVANLVNQISQDW